MALKSSVDHIILVMPGLFCGTFLQEFVCSIFREVRTGVPFLICAIWTEADWHTYFFFFFVNFQFFYVKMNSKDIYGQLITWKFNFSAVC